MRKYIIIVLLLNFLNTKSQSGQVGIGLLDLNTINQKITIADTSINGKTKSTLNFKPVTTFNYINKNNVDLSLQVGYFNERIINNTKSVYSDKSNNYQFSSTTKKSIYLKLGIAKRIDYQNFYITFGAQVPLSVNFYNYYNLKNTVKDSTGKFIQSAITTNNLPNSYYTGLLLNFGSFYKLYKNLYIGGELNYGLYYTLQYGNRVYTTNYTYSNATANNATTQTLKYNTSQFQLGISPTLHIRYTIFNKKEEVSK